MTTVLLVDDDQQIRRILRFFLEEAGCQVIETKTGTEALSLLAVNRPDVILLDVMMPGANGFDVCKALKTKPSTATVPVILVTARDRREDIVAAIESGADDYVLKPFTKDTIVKKVRGALSGGSRLQAHRQTKVERRRSGRVPVAWSVSWALPPAAGMPMMFRNPVRSLSLWGFSYEFDRCGMCTGYERNTVHPLCLVARHAMRFADAPPLNFILAAEGDVAVEVRGRFAHIYQPTDDPGKEVVGVAFTELSSRAESIIRKYVAQPA